MLKFYEFCYTTYYKGEDIYSESYGIICENKPKQENIQITWDNIKKVYEEYGMFLPFCLYDTKKGKKISFFNTMSTIKEKRTPILEMALKIKTIEQYPSINEILKYPNGKLAIQYLIERGLTILSHN